MILLCRRGWGTMECVSQPVGTADAEGSGGVVSPGPEPTRADHSPLKKTVRDIALSMGVIAGIIFLVLIVTWRPQPDPVRALDPVPAAQTAQIAADFPILLPRLGPEWRATSARFEATEESDQLPVWFNGWVGPDDQYAAVIESPNDTESFIEEQTIGGLPAGEMDDPAPATPGWEAYVSPSNGQRSLVGTESGVTTIVTGTLDWPQLIAFRDSLRPV